MRMLSCVMAGVVAVGIVAVAYAGPACCGAAAGPAVEKVAAGCPVLDKLNLTAEQKPKVEALMAECQKAGGTLEAKAKCLQGVEGLLTAEQLKVFRAECEKGACPMKSAPKAPEAAK